MINLWIFVRPFWPIIDRINNLNKEFCHSCKKVESKRKLPICDTCYNYNCLDCYVNLNTDILISIGDTCKTCQNRNGA